MATPKPAPTRVEPFSPTEMYLGWSDGKAFSVPYAELRFQCPCAGCVDEMSGQRTIRREQVQAGVRVTQAQAVGRYAIQLNFSDGHATGIYPYERLQAICLEAGKILHA